MSPETITEPVATAKPLGEVLPAKDPLTRLLNLTLGWAEYAEKDEAEHTDTIPAAAIYNAYSAVDEFAEPYWDAAPEVQEMAVRHFIDTRILPLLLGAKS